jgi:hypothetical protein
MGIDNERQRNMALKIGENLEEKLASKVRSDLGACSTCTFLFYFKRSYGESYEAHCMTQAEDSFLPIKIDHKNPITLCSRYETKGQMSLWNMKEMARIIDIKKQVGFNNEK